ncbi:uncharacterized protein [Drosophila suzukii]|uniref:Endonuclease/exonuclease/phosphatase domain-containing protein n=1 Tax=Drosophila suzukii TaxID=28584 RepID=A0ABM4TXA0_DROSZ
MVTRREDKQLSDLGSCVSKVRRTINGNLLLEVAKGSAESAEAMKESIARVLGDAASVRATSDETKLLVLEIRDIDSIATEQEIYAESQLAVISLPYSLGKAVLHRGEVRIGWTICRIRERTGPPRAQGSQVQQGAFMFILLCGRKKGDQAPGRKQTLPSHNQRERETSAVMQLIQLNLNHCRAAQDLLKQTVRELGSEVAILSEPYRVESSSDWVTDRTGKAALWLCGVSVLPMRDTRAVEGFVQANVGGTWIYSCYLAPSLSLTSFSRIMDELISDLRGRSNGVIGGDFNAWAEEWGSLYTNARGRTILEAIASLDIVLLNEGSQHSFNRAGAGSIIDLSFASSSLSRSTRWRIGEVFSASDHEAILLTVGGPPCQSQPMTGPRKAYRQDTFRTQTFASALEGMAVSELDSADVAANKLAARLEEACDQSMQQRKTFRKHHAPVYWWSEEIPSLRRTCLRARRLVQRARGTANLCACNSSFKSAKKALKLAIRDSKRESHRGYQMERTLEALRSFNIQDYLLNVVHSYLSKRELVLDTSVGPRTYEVTAGVPQGSVLGPLEPP